MVKGATHEDGKFDSKPYTPTTLSEQKGAKSSWELSPTVHLTSVDALLAYYYLTIHTF